jgi:putative addiction module component (TIGR02574 family)
MKKMETVTDNFAQNILSLPEDYRAKLADLLLRSLDSYGEDYYSETEAEAARNEVLLRRMKEIEEGRTVGYPADEVFAEIRKSCQ